MTEWPESLTDIFYGDLAVAFVYRTPAGGVVAMPVTTIGMFDEEAGTVTTSTSFGNWKKLTRLDGDSRVALAYHAREHGKSSAANFVLVQGDASFPVKADSKWMTPEVMREWSDRMPARKTGPFWDRLGREYYDERVPITVSVRRIAIWPDAEASGPPEVIGKAIDGGVVKPQDPPKNGTESRVSPGKYSKRLVRAKHTLIGFAGADGYPELYPTAVEVDGDSLNLGRTGLPEGGRRAGLLAHWFEPQLVGQGAAIMTGWLEVDSNGAIYSPHTVAGYAIPSSETMFALGGAMAAKFGYRKAVREGHVRDGVWQRPVRSH